ncbi:hypothetical protein BJ085DRAFT_18848 [Dimargaris cristalligena]|uniref:4-coumarate-CoA ligase n=1 Tax=Dimargaris cristalligena TaxID=215637 RepID=A0A4Q0A2Q7_9FUNG|nr:hypothetical protein BJ085DRAFT_18848 [Dimargaris cristalligena]|eukprot:RKP40357.1 hypothetical protein BJ085DRAFT_18848 [Dimargaris cristalligena]
MVFKSTLPPLSYPRVDIATFVFQCIHRSSIWRNPLQPVYIDSHTGEAVTISEFQTNAKELASGWQNTVGLRRGDVVAMISPNDIHYASIMLSIVLAGGIVTPANPAYTADEILHQLKDSGAKYVVADGEALPAVQAACRKANIPDTALFTMPRKSPRTPVPSIFTIRSQLPFQRLSLNSKEVATQTVYLCYSSGTTGLSKGVELTHSNIISNVCQSSAFKEHEGVSHQGKRQMGVLPFYHVYGLNLLIHANFYEGSIVVLARKFDFVHFLATIQKYSIHYAYLVPPIILALARHPAVSQSDLSSLKWVLSSAAPVSPALIEEIFLKHGLVVSQGYGMTELSPATLVTPINNPYRASTGILVSSMEGKIVDEAGHELPPNEIGELWVRGPNVMKGYLNNPQATAAILDADGFLHTGDLGHVNERGFVFISDRLKELIKYKGFQVAPAELEALIISHPKVLDVAVVGTYDFNHATEVPKAFVVLRGQEIPATEAFKKVLAQEITQFVHDNVAAHKRLRGGVEFMTEVPKNATGKILRRVLKAKEAEKQGIPAQRAKL